MENKMFFENETKIVELATPLNEGQFEWLERIVGVHHRGVQLDTNTSIIDANAIVETIKGIRERQEYYTRDEGYFDITDEELTDLITQYGYLERVVEVNSEISKETYEHIRVPLDVEIEHLEGLRDDEWYEYNFSEEDAANCGDINYWEARCNHVYTCMMFKLPTPTIFGFNTEMKGVA